jgi:hypothetical protein
MFGLGVLFLICAEKFGSSGERVLITPSGHKNDLVPLNRGTIAPMKN